MHIIDGIMSNLISCTVVTFSPIHNIVVVTSPIGDHAPPALAAMIINPTNHIRSLFSKLIF